MTQSIEKLNTKPLENNRHERFCLAILKGMSQKDAAIQAGFKPSRARKTASELVTKRDIKARIEALQEEAKGDGILTVKERKERLTKLAQEDNTGQYGYARGSNIQAIAELNKMEGEYAPSKLEHKGKVTIEWLYQDRGADGSRD